MFFKESLISILNNFNSNDIKSHFNKLIKHDRYQASEGIYKASKYLEKYFLSLKNFSVNLHQFSLDSINCWWTFEVPISWTPITAKLTILTNKKRICYIDHSVEPCSIATNSMEWKSNLSIKKLVTYDPSNKFPEVYKDALVIIRKNCNSFYQIVNLIEKAGAYGFVTDYFSKKIEGQEVVGRIELPNNSKLFGFSTTNSNIGKIISNIHNNCIALPNIDIDKSYDMPVLEAFLNLGGQKEIWIIAHLCHPRPGANDNTSGVVGILEIAKTLSRIKNMLSKSHYSIRFIFAPEFVGMAAYLHDIIKKRNLSIPEFVINMDMIGENIQRCGSKFYIERPPLHLSSFYQCILEKVANTLVEILKNMMENWDFKVSEFLGYSDHALFADHSIAVPATLLSHFPDLYNHTSGDSIENVDFNQLKKIIAIVTTFIIYLCQISKANFQELVNITNWWLEKELLNINKEYESLAYQQKIKGVILSLQNLSIELGISKYHSKYLFHKNYAYESNIINKNFVLKNQFNTSTILRKWEGPFNPIKLVSTVSLEIPHCYQKKELIF